MRPEYSGTDLHQRVSKVYRQVCWLPARPLGLIVSLMIISVLFLRLLTLPEFHCVDRQVVSSWRWLSKHRSNAK